jgi:hypothetical protein
MILKLQHAWFLYKCYRWNVKYFFDIRSPCDPFLSVGRDENEFDRLIAQKIGLFPCGFAVGVNRAASARLRSSQNVTRRRTENRRRKAGLTGRPRKNGDSGLQAFGVVTATALRSRMPL